VDFFLFVLVNAVLFLRPSEIIPALAAVPIYEVIIISNLIFAGPGIINHLTNGSLTHKPGTLCVLGVFAFVVLSHVARFDLWSARHGGFEFAKVVAYFLLLVTVVNTPRRFFTFLTVIVLFTLAVNGLAVLQYHGKIDIPALSVMMQNDVDELTGELVQIPRMRATGIFNDPNDLSMIIVVAMILLAAGLFYRQFGFPRFALAAPLGFLFYCLTLTQSRGGLLAFVAGGAALLYIQWGAVRAGLVAMAGIPLVFMGLGGRQADISGAMSGGGTGETRAELWSDGLQLFKGSPILGIGHKNFVEEVGHAAHNSFLHAFVELGFAGGLMFLGVFAVAAWSLWRLKTVRQEITHRGLRHVQPYLVALIAAYCMSMMSLSRSYAVPTYLVAGLALSFDQLARPSTMLPPLKFDGKLIQRLLISGIGFVGFIYLCVTFLYRAG
jgi:putative inorganic carbon (hco3(-)) transporter